MGYKFAIEDSHSLLVIEVRRAPVQDDAFLQAARMSIDLVRRGTVRRILIDSREQKTSALTSTGARTALLALHRLVIERGATQEAFCIAILARPDSLGYGVARMFMSHAYDLDCVSVALFEDEGAARGWLVDDRGDLGDRANIDP